MEVTNMKALSNHIVQGLAPVADAFSGAAVYSDVVNMKNWNHCQFLIYRGVAAGAGTAVITVEACSDVTPSAVVAIPFVYSVNSATDIYGANTRAEATGVTFGAGANLVMRVEVDVEALLSSGYSYVRLKSTEVVDAAYVGGILISLSEPRISESIAATVLT
jgi:hypothetical protein